MIIAAPAPVSSRAASRTPGLLVVAAAVAVAVGLNDLVPAVSPLVFALALGVLMTNAGLVTPQLQPGFALASRQLLRVGIVLLGVRIALPDILDLGLPVLLCVLAVVAITFASTVAAGMAMGLPRRRALLVATGFSICGAAAVAAMEGVLDADEEDVTTAVALVTVFGTACILVLPLLQDPLGLTDQAFGRWAGLSVHEVAQVVAVAGAVGGPALAPAVLLKLSRVLLLAPLVTVVALVERRRRTPGASGASPPLVPTFVLGFLAAAALASLDLVPPGALDVAQDLQILLMSAAMVGIGSTVRVARLVRTSGRAIALGAVSTTVIATVSYAGLAMT